MARTTRRWHEPCRTRQFALLFADQMLRNLGSPIHCFGQLMRAIFLRSSLMNDCEHSELRIIETQYTSRPGDLWGRPEMGAPSQKVTCLSRRAVRRSNALHEIGHADRPNGTRAAPLSFPSRGPSRIQDPHRKLAMAILETLKKTAEKATGLARPSRDRLEDLVRSRKANTFAFKDDGVIPNNARWPLVFYRGVVALPDGLDPAAIMEDLFELNGWGDSWRDGIYDYVHYHSRIHEVLGIARGKGTVRFGGNNGRTVQLKAGDVAVLPAGTGHQCLAASSNFLVVGAYPPSGTYDECTTSEHHDRALKTIPKVGRPRKDPVYGANGLLLSAWKSLR
jgi:uncharacterized protein YjlB